jgi:NADPH:quinone reductase-like Zn-dependent oxidoreductase
MKPRRQFLQAAGAALALGTQASIAVGSSPSISTDVGRSSSLLPPRSEAWTIGSPPSIANLQRIQRATPRPSANSVVVKVMASSINARDRGIVAGFFPVGQNKSEIPLSEGSGEVVAVGENVTRIKPGDRVSSAHFPDWIDGHWNPAVYERDIGNTLDGWLTRYALLPESGIVKLPDNIDYDSAATLSSSGVTAWHALMVVAQLKPGQWVLSLGTGGVSSMGVLLAKAAGARVIVTSSSDDKLAQMRELGVDLTVNYRRTTDWGNKIAELTSGGVDVVLENVGRATLDQSMLACAPEATIVMIGTGPLPAELPRMPGFYEKNILLKAISNGSRRMFEDLLNAMSARDLKPIISQRYSFDDAIAAFRALERGEHLGKILISHS